MAIVSRDVDLPSGAKLQIVAAPFAVSKALYQALLADFQAIRTDFSDMAALYKDLFCVGFASERIEACLWQCFERCLYDAGGGARKIDKDTFEDVTRREDYPIVCVEVVKDNVAPFAKSLFAEYKRFSKMTEKSPS